MSHQYPPPPMAAPPPPPPPAPPPPPPAQSRSSSSAMVDLKRYWPIIAVVVAFAFVLFLLWVIFTQGAAPTGGYG